MGAGYVGLPVGLQLIRKGLNVTLLDKDHKNVQCIQNGVSYISHIPSARVDEAVKSGRLKSITKISNDQIFDVVVICVPTPLTKFRQPDTSFIE